MTEVPIFDAYSRYYNLLYQDKDYAAEVSYVCALLVRSGLNGKDLLEFGSGTGKHARFFAERGYFVSGIERSAEMVAQSIQTDRCRFEQGDITSISLGRTYDAVVSLFHVISYQLNNAALRDVFARAGEHLRSGGLFAFDCWYTPAVYAEQPEVRVKKMNDGTTEIVRIAEPIVHVNEDRVDVTYTVIAHNLVTNTYQTFSETHVMRHFSLPELDLVAAFTGFERIAAEEFLTGAPPSERTWGVCNVFRKI